MMSAIRSIRDYFSLVKFSHTVFAMPFALIGFSLAVSKPEFDLKLKLLLLVIAVHDFRTEYCHGI